MSFHTNGANPLLAGGAPINIGPGAPVVFPTASFTFLGTGDTRSFTNTSQTGTYPITVYAWNFGDPSSGASNTSTAENPSHTFSAQGASYTVQLTVTDSQGNTSSASQVVAVESLGEFQLVVDDMIANIVTQARNNNTAGLGHQEDLTSATSAQLLANQQTDGSFPAYQGAAPTASNRESMYYIENYYRAYLKKMVLDYKYGQFDPTLQGDAALKAAIWRGIKGSAFWIENYYYYGRPSWTPAKWWGPQAIGWVMVMMVDDFIADRTTATTDGETIERSVQRIADVILGMGPSFNTDGSEYIVDINMSGSADNGSGANLFGPASTNFIFAVFIGKINNDSTAMDYLRSLCIEAYSIAWGKKYYVLDSSGRVDIQDYVGIHPGFQLAAHNGGGSFGTGGAKNQHIRYGYSLANNTNDFLEITVGSEYFLPAEQIEILISMYEAAMFQSIRSIMLNATGGRFFFNLGAPGKPGSWALNAQIVLTFTASLTAGQINRLDVVDEVCRRRNIVPYVEGIYNAWSLGDIVVSCGDYGGPNGQPRTEYTIYTMLGRAGSQDNIATAIAGMTSREQSPAEANINFGDGYSIFIHGSTLVGGSDFNFGQYENLVTNDPAIAGPHGSIYANTINGLPVGSSSNHPPSDALDQVQVARGFDFFLGGTFDKSNAWFTHSYQCAKVAFRLTDQHPTLTQHTHIVFEMAAGLNISSAPPAALKHNIVYSLHQEILYDFGAGQQTFSIDTSSSADQGLVTNGIIWQATWGDQAAYPYGRGTLILGSYNLQLDCVANGGNPDPNSLGGGRFRVMIDHGTAPVNGESLFISIPKCTYADLVELRDNFATYFEYVNTPQAQWVRFKPENKTIGAIWDVAMNSGVPTTVARIDDSATTFTADDSCGFIIEPNASTPTDYDVSIARNRWRQTKAPVSGGVLQQTNLRFSDKGLVQFEWGTSALENNLDDDSPDPPVKQAGTYYSGASKTITV